MALPIENNNVNNVDMQLTQLQTTLALTSPAVADTANSGAPAKHAGKNRPIMSKDTFQTHKKVFDTQKLIDKIATKLSNLTEKQAIVLLKQHGFTDEQIASYKEQFAMNTSPANSAGDAPQQRHLGNYFMIIGKFMQAGINARESSQIGRLDQVKAQQKKLDIVNTGLKTAAAQAKKQENKANKKASKPWYFWVILVVVNVVTIVVTVVTAGAAAPEALVGDAALAGAAEGGGEIAAEAARLKLRQVLLM